MKCYRAHGGTLATLAFLIVLTGCASTPRMPEAPGVVFAQPLDRTQRAAADALTVLGFDLKRQDPTYLEGARPRKVGLFVGSGGETAGVWLEPIGKDRTRVRIDTAKSFVGYVGQKNWDQDILREMEKALGRPE